MYPKSGKNYDGRFMFSGFYVTVFIKWGNNVKCSGFFELGNFFCNKVLFKYFQEKFLFFCWRFYKPE